MKDWKISVITVCFNSEKTIERTLKSVLNQTYTNYEYIVIDGKSLDSTPYIIKKYEPLFEGKMRWISEPDNGIYDAMNKGVKLSTGDLICLLNSDDWYELDAFEVMSKHYNGEKYKVQYAMQRIINEGGEEVECNMVNHAFLYKKMIPHNTCFVSKEVYKKVGLFNTDYKSAGDYDWAIRASLYTDVIFEPIYRAVLFFCEGGMSSNIISEIEQAIIKKKYGFISKKQYIYLMLRAKLLDCARKMNLV